MFTILGAGGAIGNELVKELTPRNEAIRLVSRNPTLVPGVAEAIAADLSNLDDTLKAVSGSRIVFLVIGLRYESRYGGSCGRASCTTSSRAPSVLVPG
jgi:putative NADH-flavin reductase